METKPWEHDKRLDRCHTPKPDDWLHEEMEEVALMFEHAHGHLSGRKVESICYVDGTKDALSGRPLWLLGLANGQWCVVRAYPALNGITIVAEGAMNASGALTEALSADGDEEG